MRISGKSAVLVGALAVAAAPVAGTVAEAKPKAARDWHQARAPHQPGVRVLPDGSIIDSQGWRYWNGNWDNSCFRTLHYLNSAAACSGGTSGDGG
jgi:hypothetical protein